MCYFTYFLQSYMKYANGKGIFMNNPCHYVVLFSAILLTTDKNKYTATLYVSYTRWLFGPYSALMFPVLVGFNLPFEQELFFIEHYFAAFIGPLTLILCGRYGFILESFKVFFA
jgi:TMEM164 family